ncbi:MAG TPA: hypothetical protein PKO06_08735 [Candidatus Ozemobacteraceae bacterium]|nr:hypothetical protein [Candidatus Ozemobacteraceae bacterium]
MKATALRNAMDEVERVSSALRAVRDMVCTGDDLHTVKPDDLSTLLDILLEKLQSAVTAAESSFT